MDENQITPAINLEEEMPNEMSAEEFQRRLYAWFEDRGLLSELRAHLRMQMIGVLKDTAIGRTVVSQQRQAISPKVQALNLLIAEFLLRQDYHYSLSVFSTEVPLVNVIPEFPGLSVKGSFGTQHSDRLKRWQFSEKDMWDILETLGIQRDTDDAQSIFSAYYRTINKEALLTCIIRMLHSMQTKPRMRMSDAGNKSGTSSAKTNETEVWMKDVHYILTSQNVSPMNSQQIIRILSKIIQTEKKRLEDESREEYVKLQSQLEEQASLKEKQQTKKTVEIQKSLDYERTKLESERAMREDEADTFGAKMRRHRKILSDRYHSLIVRERDLEEREEQTRQKEQYLQTKQQHIQSSYESLCQEQRSVTEMRDKLQAEKMKIARNDADFLKNLEEECKSMKNQITDTQEAVVLSLGSSSNGKQAEDALEKQDQMILKGLVRQLQTENAGLKALSCQQKLRIQELSERAEILISELENTQLIGNDDIGILSIPPLIAPHHRDGTNSFGAGGEEVSGFLAATASTPGTREYRHLSRESRRRAAPRRLMVHSSSSSDDHSPTNEILREARQRLKKLEQESEEVDRHYRQFRSRYAEQGHFSFQTSDLSNTWFSALDKAFNSGSIRESQPYFFNSDEGPGNRFGAQNDYEELAGSVNNFQHTSEDEFNRSRLEDMPQKTSSTYLNLSKYLKQENNFSLSRNSFKQQSMSNNETQKPEKSATDEEKNAMNQSAGSSGILNMLEEAGSDVSISGAEMSDEKSDSNPEGHDCKYS